MDIQIGASDRLGTLIDGKPNRKRILKTEAANQKKKAENAKYSEAFHSLVCTGGGHNFLTKGMGNDHMQGENICLLLYIAKDCQHIYFQETDQWVKAPQGSFIFYKLGQLMRRVYLGEKSAENYWINFTFDNLELFEEFFFEFGKLYTLPEGCTIEGYCENILTEHYGNLPFGEQYKTALLTELLITMVRKVKQPRKPDEMTGDGVERVVYIMRRDYSAKYTLEDYAAMCNMSKYHFCRVFKEKMQLSPLAYRNHYRIKIAQDLLARSNLPIYRIAEETGFDSTEYFSKVFRNITGLSPAAYRKNLPPD